MSDSDRTEIKVQGGSDYSLLAIVVLIIFCAGDPDLLDALIHWLMRS